MPTTIEEQINAMTFSEKLRAYIPWFFSGGILLGYAWIIQHLMGETGVNDEVWIKLTYIFSSVEAIVFTAVGFIFGREVNRARAIKAEKNEIKEIKEKKELAKEVKEAIEKLPSPTDTTSGETQSLNRLKGKAEMYLNN